MVRRAAVFLHRRARGPFMQRTGVVIAASLLLAGCQAQNPFAAFGPARVPPPGMDATAPYYPPSPGTIAAPPSQSSPATGTRASISAPSSPLGSSSPSIVAEPADREPIRIVENPAPAARTAAVPARSPAPASGSNTPPASPPSTRPAGPTAPTSGASSSFRWDQNVTPSSYQTPAASTDASIGQWRPR